MLKKISILGSTGSIGRSTLDVVARHPDQFQIVAMACGRNTELYAEQIRQFRPQLVSVSEEANIAVLKGLLGKLDFSLDYAWGEAGALAVATHPEAQHVVSAMVGAVGLAPTYAAINAGKEVGLANKETMVIAGEFMNAAAARSGAKILPVDSEHAAIFQCLNGESPRELRRLILTASGGPFLHRSAGEFAAITVEAALKHPNWSMGAKITIDSATLMNKGLELIEAKWLFSVPAAQLDVVIHPQSIIHSMVEFHDGSVMAQLGIPDMRIPIAYALSYPHRLANTLPSLDFATIGQLTFFAPDMEKFRCLALAREVLSGEGTLPAVLNAANEIAVAKFLAREIRFTQIPELVDATLQAYENSPSASLEHILHADQWAREQATLLAAA